MSFTLGQLTTSRISYMGLPQGSSLSPLLYHFYVKGIDGCLEGALLRQLADDAVVSLKGQHAETLQRPLQNYRKVSNLWQQKAVSVIGSVSFGIKSFDIRPFGIRSLGIKTFGIMDIWHNKEGCITIMSNVHYAKRPYAKRLYAKCPALSVMDLV